MTDNLPTLAGTNVLLMGPAGTGKTHSIGTLVDTGIEVFYLGLESGIESLFGYWRDSGKEIPSNLHWHILEAPTASFLELIDNAKKVNTLSFKSLAGVQDPHRSKYNQFISVLSNLNDFVDDRDGQSYGAFNEWDTSKVLVMDGLTGLNNASMSMVIGGKPVKNQAEWGIAQDQIYRLLDLLTASCKAHFVLISHVVRETDAILGGVKLTISTLGKALGPTIPPMFSDVILTVREGSSFYWDVANSTADVKSRNLPLQGKLKPDFGQILKTWEKRGGIYKIENKELD